MKEKLKFLCLFFKKLKDCYSPRSFTQLSILVPKPNQSNPLPCILVSIRNGHSKLFFRIQDLKAYYNFFKLSEETEVKITEAVKEANQEADKLEEDSRLIFQKRRLPEGVGLARTDTGEIVSENKAVYEAEQIIALGSKPN